ncbi:hypothetical protein IFM89_018768 [Coptis chinensis]|uniref:Uncharacterized protein n=1 Tax=Coptis chinensis TaxID=261450 RepID=A0A835I203_9MAGN|nr:hypothetical protein IFM89_018768 [Coptis chinensis]
MLQALKVARCRPNILLNTQISSIGRKTAVVQLPAQAKSVSTQSENQDKMSNAQNQSQKANPQSQSEKVHGDVMSHSFGEGYATRSEEEGFGGIYGDNQRLPTHNEDHEVNAVHPHQPNHPEYDRSQGSDVKEKEKARNQPSVTAPQ